VGGRAWEDEYSANAICTCIGKMLPVETIPKMEEGRIKENDRRGEFKYIFDIL
jgi:hypothetical protein